MTDRVITQHGFPAGTAVLVFPMENWTNRSAVPSGTATATGAVDSLGGLTVSGTLETGRRYVAFALSEGRGVTFFMSPGSLDLELPARKKDIVYGAGPGGEGPAGPVGPAGPQGPAGSPGAPGDPGPPGPAGEQGAAGPTGLTWQGVFDNAATYVENDAVGYGGASYFALGDVLPGGGNPTVNTGSWALLASQGATGPAGPAGTPGAPGPAGPPGTTGTWRGTWSGATTYVANDVVGRNGSSYIARSTTTNQAPESNPTIWELIAAKGTDGAATGWPVSTDQVLYVSATTGNDANSGLNWANAYRTIQAAVNDADSAGGVIYIGAGLYSEEIVVDSKESIRMIGTGAKTNRGVRIQAINDNGVCLKLNSQSWGQFENITLMGRPPLSTTLSGAHTNVQTTLTFNAGGVAALGVVAGDLLRVESETVRVVSVDSTTQVTVLRGQRTTTAASHISGRTVYKDRWTGTCLRLEGSSMNTFRNVALMSAGNVAGSASDGIHGGTGIFITHGEGNRFYDIRFNDQHLALHLGVEAAEELFVGMHSTTNFHEFLVDNDTDDFTEDFTSISDWSFDEGSTSTANVNGSGQLVSAAGVTRMRWNVAISLNTNDPVQDGWSKVPLGTIPATGKIGLLARRYDAASGGLATGDAMVALYDKDAATLSIKKLVNGVLTDLTPAATMSVPTVANNSWLEFHWLADTLEARITPTEAWNGSDPFWNRPIPTYELKTTLVGTDATQFYTNAKRGRVGLYINGAGWTLDNFTVRGLEGAPGGGSSFLRWKATGNPTQMTRDGIESNAGSTPPTNPPTHRSEYDVFLESGPMNFIFDAIDWTEGPRGFARIDGDHSEFRNLSTSIAFEVNGDFNKFRNSSSNDQPAAFIFKVAGDKNLIEGGRVGGYTDTGRQNIFNMEQIFGTGFPERDIGADPSTFVLNDQSLRPSYQSHQRLTPRKVGNYFSSVFADQADSIDTFVFPDNTTAYMVPFFTAGLLPTFDKFAMEVTVVGGATQQITASLWALDPFTLEPLAIYTSAQLGTFGRFPRDTTTPDTTFVDGSGAATKLDTTGMKYGSFGPFTAGSPSTGAAVPLKVRPQYIGLLLSRRLGAGPATWKGLSGKVGIAGPYGSADGAFSARAKIFARYTVVSAQDHSSTNPVLLDYVSDGPAARLRRSA